MIEEPWFLPTVIGTVIFLQLVLLIAVLRLSARVSRLFRLIASPVPPASQDLPKKEQFAAFRQWRDDKGLNWKGPAESV